MARTVLALGTSHTPLLALPWQLWEQWADQDRASQELVFPPDGVVLPFDVALATRVSPETHARPRTSEVFKEQARRCDVALDVLDATLRDADPDIVVVVSDDQDEWFYDNLMPSLAIYWGEEVKLIPRAVPPGSPPILRDVMAIYGDVELDIPVASSLGRHLIEHLVAQDFDVAHMSYAEEYHGGRVARRYPTSDGELDYARELPRRRQGIPHGFAFVVKRLMHNVPRRILPVIQNTCYPPNAVTPRRSYRLGVELARAIESWDSDAKIALIASGGLSHFVVDEELDHMLLEALRTRDRERLVSLPPERLRSGTSESLNWVTVGAAAPPELTMQVVD
ncbi:MAG: hypothetical protein ACRDQ1_17550, partial [Sciscionella sp.]